MPHATNRIKPRRTIPLTAALLLGLVTVAACDKTPRPEVMDAAPAPIASRTEMPGIPASGVDLSVPSASAVLSGAPSGAGTPTADGNGPNQRSSVSNAQEQRSMPLPGQANDHSNTVTEDNKPASAASR